MSFKDALASELERFGYTKAHLARLVRVDPSTVTSWTKGRTEPKGSQFSRLVKVMPRLKDAYDDPAA